MKKPRVLIVEDESSIAELIAVNLRHNGFEPIWSEDGVAAQREIDAFLPDLILLDWMLPGQSGLQLARQWRKDPRTKAIPILMLTARGDEPDKVAGLDAGADDYITKPFRPLELRARVLRLLKRSKPASPDAPLSIGRWTLDPVGHLVHYREAAGAEPESYTLTSREFNLTMLLFSRLGQTVSRAHLLETAGYETEEAPSRTLDSHVYRLRKKLHLDARRGMILRTVYGQGYQLGLAEDEAS